MKNVEICFFTSSFVVYVLVLSNNHKVCIFMLYFLYLQIILRKGDYNVYEKTIIKDKTLNIYLRLLRLYDV